MTNVAKYLLLLESLQFSETEDEKHNDECQRLELNIQTLRKHIKTDSSNLVIETVNKLGLSHLAGKIIIEECNLETNYIILMMHVLLEIAENTNFNSDAKEDLISTRHTNLCLQSVQDVNEFALGSQLHPLFYESGVFAKQRRSKYNPNCALLLIAIEFFDKMLKIKQFHISNAMKLVLRNYMAGILSMFTFHELDQWPLSGDQLHSLQKHLDCIWSDIAKVEYYQNILLFKGIDQLPKRVQLQLHRNLLDKLITNEGFPTLVATLQISQTYKGNAKHDEKQIFEIIAKIVAHKGHTKLFQKTMINHIFKFLNVCLLNDGMMDSMGAGLLALRRLYDLRSENRIEIEAILNNCLKVLSKPDDLLSGLILMEHKDFCLIIDKLYQLFCISNVECLPSELLVAYQPMLLQLYYNIPDKLRQKKQIASLITRCLNNRSQTELEEIIKRLYYTGVSFENWHHLHPRIMFCCNTQHTELTFRIGPGDFKQDFNISLALPELLMTEEFHTLTYQVFMVLLQLMSSIVEDESGNKNLELIQTEEELVALVNSEYSVKVELLLSLNTLISHQPLRAQISENAKDFLQYLRKMIAKRLKKYSKNIESADEVLLIMLTLAYEMLEQSEISESFRDFVPILEKLQSESPNKLIKQRINGLVALLNGDLKANAATNMTPFNTARSLIESNESYLQVYGIQMLLSLLRRKDDVALANGHVMLALALSTLKNKESYTFLNCVRLFVGLVYVMEAEVLEVLSGEYLNDNVAMDYRLVVGESLVRVSQELGPLCYKYKDVLLNCFMNGVRTPLNEFRMSSFANLAQICRTLSYQVHKFFNELLNIINSELTTGKYVPAKRAAVMVLTELLQGMESLLDFEDMLLPIYRLLKVIEADETCDKKMRLHASNGLKTLSEKCKKFFFPDQQLHKEIKIFGISDNSNESNKIQIL